MEVDYSPPILLPTTAPLRLTPKTPRPSPTQSYSRTGYFVPTCSVSTPSSSLRRTASNPSRAPTMPLPKRMLSTSVLQQVGAFPREGSRTVVATEGPIMAARARQRHVGGELTRRLGGVPPEPKRRTTSSAESGTRVDTSRSSSQPKSSSSISKSSMEHSRPSPGTSIRPTTPRRRWPFSSGSFWPRISDTDTPNASDSPRSSLDSGSSSEDIPIIVEKKPVVPRRGILKNRDMTSHQRSSSAPLYTSPTSSHLPNSHHRTSSSSSKTKVTFGPDPQSVTRVTLPARESSLSYIVNEEEGDAARRDRAMSELLQDLFILSSGGNRSSSASSTTINDHLDVPQVAVEQGEEDFESADVTHRASAVDVDPLGASQIDSHRFPSSVSSILSNSCPWKPEDAPAVPPLHTKRSSGVLPLATREASGVTFAIHVTQTPSPPPSPPQGNLFPIEEELDANILNDIRDIRTSEDGKLDVSALSDDQWTLRAESIDDGPLDQKSDQKPNVDLPRYSELLLLPGKARLHEKEALIYQFVVEEMPEPETSLIDQNFTLHSNHSDSSYSGSHPPTRSTSLALPTARRLRRIPRTDLLVERASQQWDREKITDDVQKVFQRDKAQEAWQLVEEGWHAPAARVQSTNAFQGPIISSPLSPSLPTGVSRAAMLPPGRMEWATVDSAYPDTTGVSGPVFRLCIAWRLATQYNAINHPFGAQEEVKVFVLGRTHEEFYRFYEGLLGRFMLEPRRHPLAKWEEVGPKARAPLDPMERPADDEKLNFTGTVDEWDGVQDIVKGKVAMLEAWTQGLLRLKGTKMGFVLESDYVRMWMAPWREGDCERAAENWRKDGHGEIGQASESIARVLEMLW